MGFDLPGELVWNQPWALLVIGPGLWAVWRWRVAELARPRWPLAQAVGQWCRWASVIVGCAALAGPVWRQGTGGPVVIIGVDVSASYRVLVGDPAGLARGVLDNWGDAPANARTAVVAFADQPRVVRPLSAGWPNAEDWKRLRWLSAELDERRTNLTEALSLMASVAPSGGGDVRLLMFSDGRHNAANGRPLTAGGFAGSPRPVWVWATAGGHVARDVGLVRLGVPTRAVGVGRRWTGSVSLRSHRPARVGVRISASRQATTRDVARLVADLVGDRPLTLSFTDVLTQPGAWLYRAELFDPQGQPQGDGSVPPWRDDQPANDALSATVTAGADGAILLVTARGGGVVSELCGKIAAENFATACDVMAPDDARLGSLDELARYSVVVLDDVPAPVSPGRGGIAQPGQRGLSAVAVAALGAAVRDRGVGLVVLGGDSSFGPGGYHLSELGELLPVDSDPRSRRPMALVLIIDNSGSMANPVSTTGPQRDQTRWELAARAVAGLAAPVLNARDHVAVVTFADEPRRVRPLAALGRDDPAGGLGRLTPAGGTALLPAMGMALDELTAAGLPPLMPRRVVVVSDGEADDLGPIVDEALRVSRDALLARLRAMGVQLSAVIAGGEGSTVLRDWAVATGGEYYQPAQFGDLPDRLLADLGQSRGYGKPGPVALRMASGGVASAFAELVALPQTPPLGGLLRTLARPTATVVMVATAPTPNDEASDEPALAYWSLGLGTVVAVPFGLEAGPRSLSGPGGWGRTGLGTLLRACLVAAMQPPGDPHWQLTADPSGEDFEIRLRRDDSPSDAPPARREPSNLATWQSWSPPRVTFAGSQRLEPVAMTPVGPDEFVARVPWPGPGSYRLRAISPGSSVSDSQQPETLATATVVVGTHPEYGRLGFEDAVLGPLVRNSGGGVLYDMAEWSDWGRAGGADDDTPRAWAIALLLAVAGVETLVRIAARAGWV